MTGAPPQPRQKSPGLSFLYTLNIVAYRDDIRALLSPVEDKILKKLSTPQKIQDYLDTVPINFESSGETYMSPRRVIREHIAHCFEGALLAAAAIAYHGGKPLLMDFRTTPRDEDHVVALYKEHGRWGAISKTNHSILRFREPIYQSPRELAMSYFHEYLEWDGRKSLRAYSAPFDLSRFAPEKWLTAEEDLIWLVNALDDSRHFTIASKNTVKRYRKAYPIELEAMKLTEWSNKKG